MRNNLSRLVRSIWFFPAILFVLVCLLAVCKISGSSVGRYNQFFYGEQAHDSNLLFGEPRAVRSDEWLVLTSLAAAQSQNGFKAVNHNIGDGQDMSVVLDIPHRGWTAVFTPQNWSFFVLPLEVAFAFKWWLLTWGLITSCYFFVLAVLPKRRWFAIWLALAVGLSPYILWWYETVAVAPFIWGFVLLTAVIKLFQAESRRARIGWMALGAYAGASLALLQYLPYIIPVGIAVLVFIAGFLLDNWRERSRQLKILWPYIAAAAVGVGVVLAAFYGTHRDVLHTITHTVYPGNRAPETVHLTIWELLAGFLNGQLQDTLKAMHYFSNQSESGNFILVAPFLLIPSAFVTWRAFRRQQAGRFTLLFLNLLLIVFAVRFLSTLNGNASWDTLLRVVPNNRILYGIGFAAILQLVVLARDQQQLRYPDWLVKAGTWLTFGVLLADGFMIRHQFHGYITSGLKIILLAASVAIIFRLVVRKHLAAAAFMLLLLSFLSSYRIHPLYRGLGPLINSPLSTAVKAVNNHRPGAWIAVNTLEFNDYLAANGVRSISGVYTYPQFGLWKPLDPAGRQSVVYNRYAQAVFNTLAPSKLYLIQSDWFEIQFNGCDPYVQQRASYILSVDPLPTTCLTPIQTVQFPAKKFYIYRTADR
jgi:hypothetical protein